MRLLEHLFHRHQWRDAFVFDSSIEVTLPTGEQRVVGQAVMMECVTCAARQRRPLTTWAEAREARRGLPHYPAFIPPSPEPECSR